MFIKGARMFVKKIKACLFYIAIVIMSLNVANASSIDDLKSSLEWLNEWNDSPIYDTADGTCSLMPRYTCENDAKLKFSVESKCQEQIAAQSCPPGYQMGYRFDGMVVCFKQAEDCQFDSQYGMCVKPPITPCSSIVVNGHVGSFVWRSDVFDFTKAMCRLDECMNSYSNGKECVGSATEYACPVLIDGWRDKPLECPDGYIKKWESDTEPRWDRRGPQCVPSYKIKRYVSQDYETDSLIASSLPHYFHWIKSGNLCLKTVKVLRCPKDNGANIEFEDVVPYDGHYYGEKGQYGPTKGYACKAEIKYAYNKWIEKREPRVANISEVMDKYGSYLYCYALTNPSYEIIKKYNPTIATLDYEKTKYKPGSFRCYLSPIYSYGMGWYQQYYQSMGTITLNTSSLNSCIGQWGPDEEVVEPEGYRGQKLDTLWQYRSEIKYENCKPGPNWYDNQIFVFDYYEWEEECPYGYAFNPNVSVTAPNKTRGHNRLQNPVPGSLDPKRCYKIPTINVDKIDLDHDLYLIKDFQVKDEFWSQYAEAVCRDPGFQSNGWQCVKPLPKCRDGEKLIDGYCYMPLGPEDISCSPGYTFDDTIGKCVKPVTCEDPLDTPDTVYGTCTRPFVSPECLFYHIEGYPFTCSKKNMCPDGEQTINISGQTGIGNECTKNIDPNDANKVAEVCGQPKNVNENDLILDPQNGTCTYFVDKYFAICENDYFGYEAITEYDADGMHLICQKTFSPSGIHVDENCPTLLPSHTLHINFSDIHTNSSGIKVTIPGANKLVVIISGYCPGNEEEGILYLTPTLNDDQDSIISTAGGRRIRRFVNGDTVYVIPKNIKPSDGKMIVKVYDYAYYSKMKIEGGNVDRCIIVDMQEQCPEGYRYIWGLQKCAADPISSEEENGGIFCPFPGEYDENANKCLAEKSFGVFDKNVWTEDKLRRQLVAKIECPFALYGGYYDEVNDRCIDGEGWRPKCDSYNGYVLSADLGPKIKCTKKIKCSLNGTFCKGEMKRECPPGYKPDKANPEYCVAEGRCPNGYVQDPEDPNKCVMKYNWSLYSCKDGFEGPIEKGADCNGECGSDGCWCNPKNPPANNCRKPESDPNGGYVIEKKRPMEYHFIWGDPLVPNEYGKIKEDITCEDGCLYYVDKITAKKNEICFFKTNGKYQCYKVDKCYFSGAIKAKEGKHITGLELSDSHTLVPINADAEGAIVSSCRMNGHMGYEGYRGGIVSINIGAPVKRYAILEVNGTYKINDDIHWQGFNIGTMALHLSDGNWYVAERFKSIEGESLDRDMPSFIKFISNHYFSEALDESVPLSCVYKGKHLEEGTCIRKVKILMPKPDLSVVGFADIESLKKLPDEMYLDVDVDINVSESFLGRVVVKGHKVPEIELKKEKVNFDSAQPIGVTDKLLFWNSFQDGQVGFLEFVRETRDEDRIEGFIPENSLPYVLADDGFTSIYYDEERKVTYIINPTDGNARFCSNGYKVDFNSVNESTSGFIQFLGGSPDKGCILMVSGSLSGMDFNHQYYSFKKEYYTGGYVYKCSPFDCIGHQCIIAECEPGFYGNLLPGYINTQGKCTSQRCDGTKQYVHSCGQKIDCKKDTPEMIYKNGRCYEYYCPEGIFHMEDKTCWVKRCPDGTYENSDGTCSF